LYDSLSINIDEYGAAGLPNPLTVEQVKEYDGDLTTLHLSNSAHVAYGDFLDELGIPRISPENIVNFEPFYLNSLMTTHPKALAYAKERYYNDMYRLDDPLFTQLPDLFGPSGGE
jgi:hypothetical protein